LCKKIGNLLNIEFLERGLSDLKLSLEITPSESTLVIYGHEDCSRDPKQKDLPVNAQLCLATLNSFSNNIKYHKMEVKGLDMADEPTKVFFISV
jgi:hypothetical protein